MKIGNFEIKRGPSKTETLRAEIEEIRKELRTVTIGATDIYGLPYTGATTALTTTQAMRLSAVYRCVDVVSSDIASMDINILEFKMGTGWGPNEFHPAYPMLNIQPNPSMSKFDFMKAVIAAKILDGNAYIWVKRDKSGNPVQLVLLLGIITMYLRDDFTTYYIYEPTYGTETVMIDGEDMIHIKNFSYDGYLGVSTLTHAANIMSLAQNSDAQAKGYFKNGVNMQGVIEVPGRILPDKATELKANFAASVAYNSTTEMAGGAVVLDQGATFKPIQVNPKDAQMLETRGFNVIDICRFMGVHPSKAFDLTGASYSNTENYQLSYLTDTITPQKLALESEINRKLFRPSQRDKLKVSFDMEELMAADMTTTGDYYTKMVQVGVYSPNEIRRKRHQPLIPDGDKSYMMVNVAPIGEKPTPDQNKNTGNG